MILPITMHMVRFYFRIMVLFSLCSSDGVLDYGHDSVQVTLYPTWVQTKLSRFYGRQFLQVQVQVQVFYLPNRSKWYNLQSVYSSFLEWGRTEKHSLSSCPPVLDGNVWTTHEISLHYICEIHMHYTFISWHINECFSQYLNMVSDPLESFLWHFSHPTLDRKRAIKFILYMLYASLSTETSAKPHTP